MRAVLLGGKLAKHILQNATILEIVASPSVSIRARRLTVSLRPSANAKVAFIGHARFNAARIGPSG